MSAGLGVLSVAVLMTLSGCAVAVSDEELFEQARGVYMDYRSAAADVQVAVLDADWVIDDYGDTPNACGQDGYSFRSVHSTPSGWRIEGTPSEAADRLAGWLSANGWSDVKKRTYSEGTAYVVVEATKPDAHVDQLTVDISPGKLYDSTTIYAYSTCEPGDALVISDLRRPGYPEDEATLEKKPSEEHPLAERSFGYTPDGQRRFWPDAQ